MNTEGYRLSELDPLPLPSQAGDIVEVSQPRMGKPGRYDSRKAPSSIKSISQATTTTAGAMQLATLEVVTAGEDSQLVVTPEGVLAAIAQLLGGRIFSGVGVSLDYDSGAGTLTISADRYSIYTVLLLKYEGANGSTDFIDSSEYEHVVSALGNAQISTLRHIMGASSGLFDGSGDYLSIPHDPSLVLVTGDFTVETYFYPTVLTASVQILITKDGAPGVASATYAIYLNQLGNMVGFLGAGTSQADLQFYPGVTTVTLNQWHHVALVREGHTIKLFLDGVNDFQSTSIPSMADGGRPVTIGYEVGQPADCYFHGNLDETRITKAARYSADFSPL